MSGQAVMEHPWVVVAGVEYLRAVARDLEGMAMRQGAERLFVISVGAKAAILPAALASCLVPLDMRIERVLGGPRSTLNQRTLQWLLREVVPRTGWSRCALDEHIATELGQAAEVGTVSRESRKRMDDEAIMVRITQQMQQNPQATRSQLLAEMRRSGLACEQGRFARLVERVKAELQDGAIG